MTDQPVIPAGVQIPSDPQAPIVFEFDSFALRIALVAKEHVAALPAEAWDRPGVYALLGPLGNQGKTKAYIGKATRVRSRLGHHRRKPKLSWWRAIAVVRDTTNGFNSAEIGYLEGRLSSQLGSLPTVDLVAGRADIDQTLPDHLLLSLDTFVPTIVAALRVAGIDAVRPEPNEKPPAGSSRATVPGTVAELVAAGLVRPGDKLIFDQRGERAEATVNAAGEILLNGVSFSTPSAAGIEVLGGKSVNGWTAWRAGENGPALSVLRERLKDRS